jgi:transcriptional regulator NrdR family protein
MICPQCGNATTKHGIYKTSHSKRLNAIRRVRWCSHCRKQFITYEVLVDESKIQEVDDWTDLPNIHLKS